MSVLEFIAFSCLYPVNLYIFELCLKPKTESSKLKTKITSILVSCFILSTLSSIDRTELFNWNVNILKWTIIGLLPFLIPFYYCLTTETGALECGCGDLLFWRNFIIAPACEELYFRILLPQLCKQKFLLSLSFSLAHAHPLIFKCYRNRLKVIVAQCGISFCFGYICNSIRTKMSMTACNFWVWTALTIIHGVANYCGVPIIDEKRKISFFLQLAVLFGSLFIILK